MIAFTSSHDINFTAIDFETANNNRYSACALGLVQVKSGTIVSKKTFLIRPPERYFKFSYIHGLTWEHVKDMPTFAELWPFIKPELLTGDFLVAHNAPFDRSVLTRTCEYYGIGLPELRFECTVKLARNVLGIQPARLPNVCEVLGITLNKHHDPLADAVACAKIMLHAAKLE